MPLNGSERVMMKAVLERARQAAQLVLSTAAAETRASEADVLHEINRALRELQSTTDQDRRQGDAAACLVCGKPLPAFRPSALVWSPRCQKHTEHWMQ